MIKNYNSILKMINNKLAHLKKTAYTIKIRI